jgi:hypothetical protein
MEHAEAHELLSDLALEPRRLAALGRDTSPEGLALSSHLASCDECSADLAEWQRTWTELGQAIRVDDGGEQIPGPPADLRDRVLAGATARPAVTVVPLASRQRPRRSISRSWLVTAAAVLVAALAATSTYLRTMELDRLHGETAELAAAAASLDHVLGAERYWTVTLRTADGAAGGTLAWSATDVVVLTSSLPSPGPGQGYRCWLERDGSRSPMGWMSFSRSTGFWAASMTDYGPGSLRPGGRFGISLVPASGGGTPVLVGEL